MHADNTGEQIEGGEVMRFSCDLHSEAGSIFCFSFVFVNLESRGIAASQLPVHTRAASNSMRWSSSPPQSSTRSLATARTRWADRPKPLDPIFRRESTVSISPHASSEKEQLNVCIGSIKHANVAATASTGAPMLSASCNAEGARVDVSAGQSATSHIR